MIYLKAHIHILNNPQSHHKAHNSNLRCIRCLGLELHDRDSHPRVHGKKGLLKALATIDAAFPVRQDARHVGGEVGYVVDD